MSISGRFHTATGVLTVSGHKLADTITISRDANGRFRINGGKVPIMGDTPTVANTTEIRLLGQGSDDVIVTPSALPVAMTSGGGGGREFPRAAARVATRDPHFLLA